MIMNLIKRVHRWHLKKSLLNKSKDDTASFKHSNHSTLLDQAQPDQQAGCDILKKSVASADDTHIVYFQHSIISETEKRNESLFRPILEEEQENETTQRHTNLPALDELERQHQVEVLNHGKSQYQEPTRSINDSAGSESLIIKPCMKNNKTRNHSHQHIDIKAFREKFKTYNSSFKEEARFDIEGHKIMKGGGHKIKFADEVIDERKHSLATTHYVESYKRYNAPTCFEK